MSNDIRLARQFNRTAMRLYVLSVPFAGRGYYARSVAAYRAAA